MSNKKYEGLDLQAMSFAKNYHNWILDEFKEYLSSNVAEIGAGTGSFSKLLLSTNIQHLCAYEPSAEMFSLLQKEFVNENRATLVNDFFESNCNSSKFNSIIYVNVLEHIEDDVCELKKYLIC